MKPLEPLAGHALPGDPRPDQADRPRRARTATAATATTPAPRRGSSTRSTAGRRAASTRPEEVLLDGNELAKGEKFLSVGRRARSATTATCSPTRPTSPASASTRCVVKDLRTGKLLAERIREGDRRSPGRPTTRRSSTSPRTRQAAVPALPAHPRRPTRRTTRSSTRRRTSSSASVVRDSRDKKYLFLARPARPPPRSGLPGRPARRPSRSVILPREDGPRVRRRPPRRHCSTSAPTRAGERTSGSSPPRSTTRAPEHWKELIPHRPR